MLASLLSTIAAGVAGVAGAIITVVRIVVSGKTEDLRRQVHIATDVSPEIPSDDSQHFSEHGPSGHADSGHHVDWPRDSTVELTRPLQNYRHQLAQQEIIQSLMRSGRLDRVPMDIEAALRRWMEMSATVDFPITIYLSNEASHEAVEAAVESVLNAAGITIEERDDPILGSWFRRMGAKVGSFARSPLGKEVAATAMHAADGVVSLKRDAEIAALLSQNIGSIITSLQPTLDAVLRLGPLLILKLNGVVIVHQLTAAQQLLLDHEASLLTSPHEAVLALGLSAKFRQQQVLVDEYQKDGITPQVAKSAPLLRGDVNENTTAADREESEPAGSLGVPDDRE